MKREGEGRCHQVPALLKHHGEQKNAPSSKQWQKHKEHWDWTCAVTTLQVEAMDIMKAVESGMGSHSQLLYKKKYLKGTISGRMLLALEGLEGFEGFMFSNLRGVGIEWY